MSFLHGGSKIIKIPGMQVIFFCDSVILQSIFAVHATNDKHLPLMGADFKSMNL